ncbi:hypothetical protein ET464_08015 [Paenibacillus protaetiae]|uniref:Uncharacterized protein n=1 Tax=Paenibacillus protaetiae TaxID=2509456 RepID=A0A4P6ET77_9BACL|nr:hypothetical protein ET464_08015 [Paenibacillus protaetiae]
MKVNASYSRSIIGTFVLSSALFVAVFLFYQWILSSSDMVTSKKLLTSLWAAYQGGSIPFGWQLLNLARSKTDSGGTIATTNVHFIFWIIKVVVSIVIGVVATPFMLYRSIKKLKEMKSLAQEIRTGGISA